MKKKNQKGFTLIELIVVIAILAILALIAIPRFAGFTDRAKIQADEQYAALVGNSAVVLLADNTFTSGGTIKMVKDSSTALATGTLTAEIGDFDIAEITALVSPKDLQYYDSITVTITIEGDHWISQTVKDSTTVNIAQDGTES